MIDTFQRYVKRWRAAEWLADGENSLRFEQRRDQIEARQTSADCFECKNDHGETWTMNKENFVDNYLLWVAGV